MKPKNDIPAAELQRIFRYDVERDVLVRISLNRDTPGTNKGNGYFIVRVKGRNYGMHRVVWTVVHGEWPQEEIDHIDGDRKNNKISNLREATRAQNNRNTRVKNKTGFKGVRFDPLSSPSMPFRARIDAGGKRRDLGRFATPEEAHKAYFAAAVEAFGIYARG